MFIEKEIASKPKNVNIYMAPEVISSLTSRVKVQNFSADIYSLGVVFLQIIFNLT
jgi:serine/threonine protein kinase